MFKHVQTCSKLVQMLSNGSKFVQNCFKWVQMCSNVFKWVNPNNWGKNDHPFHCKGSDMTSRAWSSYHSRGQSWLTMWWMWWGKRLKAVTYFRYFWQSIADLWLKCVFFLNMSVCDSGISTCSLPCRWHLVRTGNSHIKGGIMGFLNLCIYGMHWFYLNQQ